MTNEPAPEPITADEAVALADHLAAWADTLPSHQRWVLGEMLARAATAPPAGDPNTIDQLGRRARRLSDPVYDRFFARLQEAAPDLTVPDA